MVKVPPLGLFTTLSSAAGGVHDIDPESVAVSPLSAVELAAGLGWEVQAVVGVLAGLDTVTVTDSCGAIVPRLHTLSLHDALPISCEVVLEVQVRPPLVGRASLNRTL